MGRRSCAYRRTIALSCSGLAPAKFLLVVLLVGGGNDLVDGREWRDVLSDEDIESSSLRGGSSRESTRPGELRFGIEEDPFAFPPPSDDEGESGVPDFDDIPTYLPTVLLSSSSSSVVVVDSESVPAIEAAASAPTSSDAAFPNVKPQEHNVFVRQSVSRTRDIHSHRTSRTFVQPTESPMPGVVDTSSLTPPEASHRSSGLTRSAILPIPTSTTAPPEGEKSAAARYVYPENSVPPPDVPPRGYFNYDTSTTGARYGPGTPVLSSDLVVEYVNNAWVNNYDPPPPLPPPEAMAISNGLRTGDYFYWDEFGSDHGFGPWKGTLRDLRSSEANRCGGVGRQSPIDVRPNGVACLEHHQIRSRRGDFRIFGAGDHLDLSILPSKLRVGIRRRPCRQLENPVCSEPDPPHADFPHGWPGFADVLHVDFKFPAEHRISGKSFDGEMQIYHLHPGRRRLPVVTVLMEAAGEDGDGDDIGHNDYLQEAIDGFQYEYDANRARCAAAAVVERGNRRRGLRFARNATSPGAAGGAGSEDDERNEEERRASRRDDDDGCRTPSGGGPRGDGDGEQPTATVEELAEALFGGDWDRLEEAARTLESGSAFAAARESHRRRLSGIWNPHHEALVPSVWFYGYDGSLTEPPCAEIVSWFVIDEPMRVSRNQLERMKSLLFTNVDGSTCRSTSVHHRNSVARPIQETGAKRQIWHCTAREFLPD